MTTRDQALRALGHDLPGRDLACYAAFGKDPDEPILGGGPRAAKIACLGRDPGRDEVKHGVPFIGAGGQKLRAGLHRAQHGVDPPDFAASVAAGNAVFWANMVPFKPFENKAWPAKVVKAFRPWIVDFLTHEWEGTDVITLGQGALLWFGLDGPKPVKEALRDHWASDARFETSIAVPLGSRTVRIHPLPHPSPLNATWTPRFPGLLAARLTALGFP